MRPLLLCALFACRDATAQPPPPMPVGISGDNGIASIPAGVPPPVDANGDAIVPLPPVPDALPPIDAPTIPK